MKTGSEGDTPAQTDTSQLRAAILEEAAVFADACWSDVAERGTCSRIVEGLRALASSGGVTANATPELRKPSVEAAEQWLLSGSDQQMEVDRAEEWAEEHGGNDDY